MLFAMEGRIEEMPPVESRQTTTQTYGLNAFLAECRISQTVDNTIEDRRQVRRYLQAIIHKDARYYCVTSMTTVLYYRVVFPCLLGSHSKRTKTKSAGRLQTWTSTRQRNHDAQSCFLPTIHCATYVRTLQLGGQRTVRTGRIDSTQCSSLLAS